MGTFSSLDVAIFLGSLIAVMFIGLWAGRKEETPQDFYLAGKTARWWGVAGSIFGSNVSANHIVGMMGVGFTLGFVESHFEITAIAGLLLMCYGFLPVYRKLNVYTLSEYLSQRYNDSCRLVYATIMIITIVVIQIVPSFYIGSRSLNILLLDEATILTTLEAPAETLSEQDEPGQTAENHQKVQIDFSAYVVGILVMAVVTGTYTIVGGLKAVIITDVIQSVMMILAGMIVAIVTFSTAEIGGWTGMMAIDADAGAAAKMHLYLPSDHPKRPWTGMLTGLLILHFYYWGTNQYIVQRALAARSDREARFGIITAGFFKLLIPFMSIGTGVAAYYLFTQRMPGVPFDGDTAFPMLLRWVVAPLGYGVVGMVAAGLIGAILSSIDSMLNSGATIITFDVYRRYFRPEASDRELVRVGRICIAIFVFGGALLSILIMDPNREENFFTYVASHTSKLVTGVAVAFALGMFWKRATPAGGLVAMLAGIVFSYGAEEVYNRYLGVNDTIAGVFGSELNFLHSALVAAILAVAAHVVVSLLTQPDQEKSKLTWELLGGHEPGSISRTVRWLGVTLVIYATLAVAMVRTVLEPSMAGWVAAGWTLSLFIAMARTAIRRDGKTAAGVAAFVCEDRTWAGLLAATAIYMMFYYY